MSNFMKYERFVDKNGQPHYSGYNWRVLAVIVAGVVAFRMCSIIERIAEDWRPRPTTVMSPDQVPSPSGRHFYWPERQ